MCLRLLGNYYFESLDILLQEWHGGVDHEIDDDPQRPHIAPVIISLHVQNFRGAVHGCSNIERFACVAVRIHHIDQFSASEIANLYCWTVQQNVFWFEIPMENAFLVECHAPVQNLADDGDNILLAWPTSQLFMMRNVVE